MAGRYKAYLEYKQPDIKFVNDIPTHWVISKVRHISTFGRGLPITKANLQDTGIPCVSYGEVHSKFGFEVDPSKHALKCVSEEYLASSPYALLSKGDFVFADTSEDIDGSGNFTQLVSDETLLAGYHTVIVRPSPANYYRFVAYLFDSPEFRTQVRDAVKGVKVFSVTQAILKNASVWLPSFEEQQKIANFLDHETAKIDTLIAKQETLIELLKEKRQAVISHAVTKGLNPDAPMKNSGVEWLGEVPEHWAVSKFAYLKTVLTDYTANGSFADLKANVEYRDSPSFARLVRLTDLRVDLQNDNGVWIDEGSYKYLRKSALYGGEFLLANVGAYAGLFYQMPFNKGPASLAPNMFMAKFNTNKVEREFMAYVGQSDGVVSQLKLSATAASAQPKLNKDDFKGVRFTYPSMEEQQQIVDYLNAELPNLDLLMSKQTKAIELMKERKTALISAAVTGKIDVRDWEFQGIEG
ncbi:restriction endonuclease subunit S [Vibrio parahaemolyticus]|uniref:restriction endonuclease subunit S n=1 Tax=Vibrio parahaemolyticus TaxID=670 RepID=UPI00046F45A7|nr:restriction endonuclease subunit S [Vibrio parahaemolyticus]MDK9417501.1 restriction endonuclease subunit S [Vibrio parahaemolyticus]MDK9504883.1 restriction endonuclease subunit S [Vibrio parahaemolyticus]MQP58810.1 restriction endonuclease subunit S [Vibrio parahaemolyticus]MQZ04051.1 restriction endonuclease subunit S [Vibrio parahaemolyticus]MQZ13011.1 restriction endonuclease subunit S [Vibrio parahaemolyticus]